MADAFIIDACRTPRGIGKQGKGALAHLHPQHLAATVLEALVDRNGFDTADVDDVMWGTSSQVVRAERRPRPHGGARRRLRRAGERRHARPLLRLGHHREQLRRRHGDGRPWRTSSIGGGTEMMSLPKKGLLPMGANNAHLQEIHPQSHQGVCADAIATLEGIDRARPSTSTRPSRSAAPRSRSRRVASTGA